MIDLQPGTKFANRYEVRKALGRGSTGKIFLTEDTIRRERVIVRIFYEDLVEDAGGWEGMIETLRYISALNHPAIVRVHDFNRWEGHVFLVTEHLTGQPLGDDATSRGESLNPERLREWLEQAVDCLANGTDTAAHLGIHPSNIWITAEGSIKLSDFGLAQLLTVEKRKATALAHGKSSYLAPELFEDETANDFLVDQYALGCVFRELINELPSKVSPPSHSALSSLKPIIKRMTQRNPQKRWGSPETLLQATRSVNRSSNTPRVRLELLQRFLPTSFSHRGWTLSLVGIAIALITLFWNKQAIRHTQRTDQLAQIQATWHEHHAQRMQFLASLGGSDSKTKSYWEFLDPVNDAIWLQSLTIVEGQRFNSSTTQFQQRVRELESQLAGFRENLRLAQDSWQSLNALENLQRQFDIIQTNQTAGLPDSIPKIQDAISEVRQKIERRSFGHAHSLATNHHRALNASIWEAVTRIQSNAHAARNTWYTHLAQIELPRLEPNHDISQIISRGEAYLHENQYAPALDHFSSAAAILDQWNQEWERAPSAKTNHWTNSIGMRFVDVGPWKVSIWETRILDFAAYIAETGAQARFLWRREAADPRSSPFHPVTSISHLDATRFCDWLTERERRLAKIPKNWAYRLPQDREWSLIAGLESETGKDPFERHLQTLDHWPWGHDPKLEATHGNYFTPPHASQENNFFHKDPYTYTAPVGQFSPNRHGLFDIGGNVWEQTSEHFRQAAQSDPNASRALRGGSWRTVSLEAMRTSYRLSRRYDRDDIGFRCLLAPSTPETRSPANQPTP